MSKISFYSLLFIAVFTFQLNAQPFGNSIYLNGSSDLVKTQNHPILSQGSTISIEAWIRPCDVQGSAAIASLYWCTGTQNAYSLLLRDSAIGWYWGSGSCPSGDNDYRSNQGVIKKNQWQHIAVVHTPTSVTFYYNGQPISGSLTVGNYSTIINSNEELRIGALKSTSGPLAFFYEGQIDELRIWDYDLSANDVQNRYNTTLNGNEVGLITYYKLDETGTGDNIIVVNSATSTGSGLNGITDGSSTTPIFYDEMTNPCIPLQIPEFTNENCSVKVFQTNQELSFVSTEKLISVELFDVSGKNIFSNQSVNGTTAFVNKARHKFPIGVYVAKIETDLCSITEKIIIQ